MGLYRLLAGLRDRQELRRFYDETIGALDRYDREHGTDLVSTLETFFWHNANVSRAARALYVQQHAELSITEN